jgi:hypothetical protein
MSSEVTSDHNEELLKRAIQNPATETEAFLIQLAKAHSVYYRELQDEHQELQKRFKEIDQYNDEISDLYGRELHIHTSILGKMVETDRKLKLYRIATWCLASMLIIFAVGCVIRTV